MSNADYFMMAKIGPKYEVNHYLFRELYIAFGGVFLEKHTGIDQYLLSKMGRERTIIRGITYHRLEQFLNIFDESAFNELYYGIDKKRNAELKLFGKKYKEKYGNVFAENAARIEASVKKMAADETK